MKRAEERKIRSDKRRGVQPTISIELKDCIYRLSYITDKHVKDVAEEICRNGFGNKKIISYLSLNFRRDIRIDNTLYLGDVNRISVRKRASTNKTERISIRFKSDFHESLSVLAYAMDCSIARACGLLLDASVREVDFINGFVRDYLSKHIDDSRMKELKQVLKYINANNPYSEEVSWFAFVEYLMSEMRNSAEKVHETVSAFVVNKWNNKS